MGIIPSVNLESACTCTHVCIHVRREKGKKNTVASERETSKNMIRKAEYMVHSMTASKRVQVWVTGGSGCSEPH